MPVQVLRTVQLTIVLLHEVSVSQANIQLASDRNPITVLQELFKFIVQVHSR